MNVEDIVWKENNLDQEVVSNTPKKEENATIRKRHCHETDVDDKTVHHNFTCQLTS